jgi:hypothetical protein
MLVILAVWGIAKLFLTRGFTHAPILTSADGRRLRSCPRCVAPYTINDLAFSSLLCGCRTKLVVTCNTRRRVYGKCETFVPRFKREETAVL